MGMAASQARLLSITSRLADNELRAQLINNSKMRLATESSKVSEEYVSALNSATMMMSNYDIEGNSQYQQLTFNALTAYSSHNNQYGLVDANGRILVSEDDAVKFRNAKGDLDTFLAEHGLVYSSHYFTPEILGGDSVQIMGTYGVDGTEFEIGTFTLEQLKTMYEGGEYNSIDYEGYNKDLQSFEYSQYIDAYNKFVTIDEELEDKIKFKKEEYLNGSKNSNGINPIQNAKDTITNYSEKSIKEIIAAANTLWDHVYDRFSTGNTYSASMYDYFHYDGTINEIHVTYENNSNNAYNTDSDNKILKADDQNYSKYDYVTYEEKEENGTTTYTLKIGPLQDNEENNDITGHELILTSTDKTTWTVSTMDDNVSNLKWGSTSLEVGNSITLTSENKLTYDYDDISHELFGFDKDNNTYDHTRKLTKDEVGGLAKSFLDMYLNCAEYLNKDKFLDDTDKKLLKEVTDNLINVIFTGLTENERQFIESNKMMLNDPGWIIANRAEHFPGKTTDVFNTVENIFILDSLFNIYGEPAMGWIDENNPKENADAKVQWYTNLFNRMKEGYRVLEDGLASSNQWIQFALESGLVTMEQVDGKNMWVSMTHANCSDITEVMDDVMIAKAEAEYNKAMNNIENKDKRFDMELKNIDTEHNALQTEYDSIKNVIGKNIERSFKIYS